MRGWLRRRPSAIRWRRASGGKREFDPARAHLHQRADFEQLQPYRARGGVGELGVTQADAAHGTDENIGERGEPEPQLVGLHGRRRGAVGELSDKPSICR